MAKLRKDARMPSTIPRSVTSTPAGSLVSIHNARNSIRNASQILSLRAYVDVHRAADLVVIHFGRRFKRGQLAHHVQARGMQD